MCCAGHADLNLYSPLALRPNEGDLPGDSRVRRLSCMKEGAKPRRGLGEGQSPSCWIGCDEWAQSVELRRHRLNLDEGEQWQVDDG